MKGIKILVLLSVVFLLLFGCSKDDNGTTGPSTTTFDNALVGTWFLVSYEFNNVDQGWTGEITFESNGNFNGQFTEVDSTVTYSGTATTSGTKLTTTIIQTTDEEWVETGVDFWQYEISNDVLTTVESWEDTTISITWTKTQPGEDYGSISGTVTESSKGDPIEDATVEVLTTGLTTTTSSDGSYQIDNIPVGTYNVEASKSGYSSQTLSDIEVNEGQTSTNINFVLEQTTGYGTVTGFVADVIEQMPVQGASITIDGTNLSATSGVDGLYTIDNVPTGIYTITCTKDGYEDQTIYDNILSVGETIYVDFLLLPEGTINIGSLKGIVTDSETSLPLVGVVIQIEGLPVGYTSLNGTYEILQVPEGNYTVSFTLVGYLIKTVEDVQINDGEVTTLNVELTPTSSGTGTLFCTVRDASSNFLLEGVYVEILTTELSATTSMIGTCTIQNIPAGTYTVKFSKTGYVTHNEPDVEIQSGGYKTLNISLQPK